MANSKITIEFLSVPFDGDFLSFSESNLGLSIIETFRYSRFSSYQTDLPEYSAGPGYNDYVSKRYKDAFNPDYNSGNLFTITHTIGSAGSGLGSVVIEANYANAFFTLTEAPPGTNVIIDNQAAVDDFSIDSITFTAKAGEESSKCNVNIATNHLATKLLQPFSINSNTANPIIFPAPRAYSFTVEVEDANGLRKSQLVTTPDFLDIDSFVLTINNSPNGATVTSTSNKINGLVLQYSLNGTTWQSSAVFTGLAVGTYGYWVKDQFGVTRNKSFSVDEFGIYVPYFYISKSNSIRFANRISWGDAANYKNDENTLGAEVDVQLAYSGCQNFKSANVITTQFKSNYQTNTVKVIKEDLSEVNVPVIKKTDNIGKKDKRDAFKFNLGSGKTGVYFLTGNVYDFDTNAIIDTHSLEGNLPEWAVSGGYVTIDNAWYLIDEVYYDETKSADVIVFSAAYTGADVSIVAGSVYNDFNYEVYEFTIDMVDYLNQTIQVQIQASDTHFETITLLSEKLDVAINFDKNVEIYYWNNDNTDIFYATGIRHLINVEVTKQEGVVDEESETYKTDTTAMLLSGQLYELDKFTFEPVSKEIWRKLMIALSHKNVFINGVQYVKSGNFDTEGPLEKSNLYVLKATMLKTGIVYNADSAEGDDFNTANIQIPGLIQTQIGFVKY